MCQKNVLSVSCFHVLESVLHVRADFKFVTNVVFEAFLEIFTAYSDVLRTTSFCCARSNLGVKMDKRYANMHFKMVQSQGLVCNLSMKVMGTTFT